MRGSSRSIASACFASVALLAVACARENVKIESDAGASASASASAGAGAGAGAGASASARAAAGAPPFDPSYLTASPTAAKAIGHTSLVLKLTLEGGLVAAFKPRSRKPLGTTRYRAEIAAYRIARALGSSNVPVALARKVDGSVLRDLLAKGPHGAKADELLPDDDGRVRGALMPWIKYELYPLEREPLRSRAAEWLTSKATISGEDKAIAAQIATLFVFDYYIANWDRMSGGNVAIDKATSTLLFVDNDGAFYESPDGAKLADQLATLRKMTRFSRGFIRALRAFGLHDLERAVGEEVPGVPLLSKNVIDMAEERRSRILKIVDAKIASDGEANVLVFE
jgi:hypothetical protein